MKYAAWLLGMSLLGLLTLGCGRQADATTAPQQRSVQQVTAAQEPRVLAAPVRAVWSDDDGRIFLETATGVSVYVQAPTQKGFYVYGGDFAGQTISEILSHPETGANAKSIGFRDGVRQHPEYAANGAFGAYPGTASSQPGARHADLGSVGKYPVRDLGSVGKYPVADLADAGKTPVKADLGTPRKTTPQQRGVPPPATGTAQKP
jgi:hypothetical protein